MKKSLLGLFLILSLKDVVMSKIPNVQIIEDRFECEVSDRDLSVRVKCPFVAGYYCFENCLPIITCEEGKTDRCIPKEMSDSCRITKEGGKKKISLAIDKTDERSTGDWQCEQRGLRSKRIHFASINRIEELPVSTEEAIENKEMPTTPIPQVEIFTKAPLMTSTTSRKNMAIESDSSNPMKVVRNEASDRKSNAGALEKIIKFLTRFDVVIPIIVLLAVSLLVNIIVSIRWCMNQSYKVQMKSDKKSNCLKLCLCKDEVQDESLMKNSVFVSPKSFFTTDGNISYHDDFDLRYPLLHDPNQMNRIQGLGTLRGVHMRPYESLRVSNSLNNATSQPVLLLSPMMSQRNEPMRNSTKSQNLFNAFEAKRNFFRKPLEQESNKINYPTYDDIASTSTSIKRNEQNNEEYYVEENSSGEGNARQKDSSDEVNTSLYKKNPAMVQRRKLIGDDDSGIEKRMTPYWIERGENEDETRALHEQISDPSNLLDKADFLLQEADKLITKRYFN